MLIIYQAICSVESFYARKLLLDTKILKPKYKRMLEGMKESETEKSEPWHLYILECADGTFYTGVAKDIHKRLDQHNSSKGAKYTRTRLPVKIVYHEMCASRSSALIRECVVKAFPREKKKKLILGEV
jgi:putative endonuclease